MFFLPRVTERDVFTETRFLDRINLRPVARNIVNCSLGDQSERWCFARYFMGKKPVVVITDPENLEFYRALPLWDESVELHSTVDYPRNANPLHADLVLIDCGFDDLQGLSILAEIKSHHPAVPVMFLTDAGSEETAVSAFRAGARDYIKKPVNLMELLNMVMEFLEIKRSGFLGRRRIYLVDHAGDTTRSQVLIDIELPANLIRVVRFVKENFEKPISTDLMANEAGLSKCHFCREFKKTTGMSPMNFLSLMRVRRATILLKKKLPVSTIALKVGFNELSSFNRHFKRFTGLSPTAYRNSLLRDS